MGRTHRIASTGVARSLPRECGRRRTMHFCRYHGPVLRGALEGQSWEFSPSGCCLSGGVVLSQLAVFLIIWSHCAWQLPFRGIRLVVCALAYRSECALRRVIRLLCMVWMLRWRLREP